MQYSCEMGVLHMMKELNGGVTYDEGAKKECCRRDLLKLFYVSHTIFNKKQVHAISFDDLKNIVNTVDNDTFLSIEIARKGDFDE